MGRKMSYEVCARCMTGYMNHPVTIRLTDSERETLVWLVARWNEDSKARGRSGNETASSVIRGLLANEAVRLGIVPTPDAPAQELVYFIQSSGRQQLIKIGHTTNLPQRLSALRTIHVEPLEVLFTFPGKKNVERELHKQFVSACITGEWFRPTPELLAYIEERKGQNGAPGPAKLVLVPASRESEPAPEAEAARATERPRGRDERLDTPPAPAAAPANDSRVEDGPPALPPWVGVACGRSGKSDGNGSDDSGCAQPDQSCTGDDDGLTDGDLDELLRNLED